MKKKRRSRKAQVGKSPGTLVADPNALKSKVLVMAFDATHLEEFENPGIAKINELMIKYPTTWIQVIGVGDTELIQEFGKNFDLHRLTLEDVVSVEQRPKVEHYGDLLFMIGRVIESIEECRDNNQISFFLGSRFLLTFQEKEFTGLQSVKNRIRNKVGRLRLSGPDYLCYTVLDCMIDQYFPVIEQIAEQLDTLEESLFVTSQQQVSQKLHRLKHDLLGMRRTVWPLRDMLSNMLRESSPRFAEETKIHLRDCYDHTVQMIELLENYRELSASLMDLSVSMMSHRLNEGIRILTVISTVFIPLNFIAGVYGMNFNTDISSWNMPELNWTWGYPFALGLMTMVTLIQIYAFWRKGWLFS